MRPHPSFDYTKPRPMTSGSRANVKGLKLTCNALLINVSQRVRLIAIKIWYAMLHTGDQCQVRVVNDA